MAVDDWFNAAGRVPLLTPAEELHLGAAIRRWLDWDGRPPESVERRGRRARDRMVTANLRLVAVVAGKFRSRGEQAGMPFEDLLQTATLGLVRGAEKFDPARGYKFSTYAYWWINQACLRGIDNHHLIHVPVHISQGIRKGIDSTYSRAGIAALGITSLDKRVGDGDTNLAELIAAPDGDDPLEAIDRERLVAQAEALVGADEWALAVLATEHGVKAAAEAAGIGECRARRRVKAATERLTCLAG